MILDAGEARGQTCLRSAASAIPCMGVVGEELRQEPGIATGV